MRQRGVEIVEFALVLPVLLLVIFLVLQFGWMMNNYLMVTAAASAGARQFAASRTPVGAGNITCPGTPLGSPDPNGYPCAYSDTVKLVVTGPWSAFIKPDATMVTLQVISGGVTTTCATDAACRTALVQGAQAKVTLVYPFTGIVSATALSAVRVPTQMTATMTETVQ